MFTKCGQILEMCKVKAIFDDCPRLAVSTTNRKREGPGFRHRRCMDVRTVRPWRYTCAHPNCRPLYNACHMCRDALKMALDCFLCLNHDLVIDSGVLPVTVTVTGTDLLNLRLSTCRRQAKYVYINPVNFRNHDISTDGI